MFTNIRLLLSVVLLFLLAGCAPNSSQSERLAERSIIVTGEGKITVRPDIATFIIVIQNAERDIEKARQKNETITANVRTILSEYKISESDISEDFIRSRTDTRANNIYWYETSRSIKVTLRDLSNIDIIFLQVLEAGAYQITASISNYRNGCRFKIRPSTLPSKLRHKKRNTWQMS